MLIQRTIVTTLGLCVAAGAACRDDDDGGGAEEPEAPAAEDGDDGAAEEDAGPEEAAAEDAGPEGGAAEDDGATDAGDLANLAEDPHEEVGAIYELLMPIRHRPSGEDRSELACQFEWWQLVAELDADDPPAGVGGDEWREHVHEVRSRRKDFGIACDHQAGRDDGLERFADAVEEFVAVLPPERRPEPREPQAWADAEIPMPAAADDVDERLEAFRRAYDPIVAIEDDAERLARACDGVSELSSAFNDLGNFPPDGVDTGDWQDAMNRMARPLEYFRAHCRGPGDEPSEDAGMHLRDVVNGYERVIRAAEG